MNRKALALATIVTIVAGCQIKPLPDPNDPRQVKGAMQADVLRRNIQSASDLIFERVAKGEISDARGHQILAEHAAGLLDGLKIEDVPENKAWEFADVCLTAERWEQAEGFLKIALKHPPDQDRRVNDTLRYARCEAELGRPEHAIELTRSTFDTPPNWKWPILYATYLEIVPAALKNSHGYELKLARLVEDAIHQHEQAQADFTKESDRGWLAGRAHHIRMAWVLIGNIYKSVNRADLAKEAEERAKETGHVTQV